MCPRRLKQVAPSFDWLNAEEGERFLWAIDAHYPQWSALFWTALRTGLRRGELFALQWDDLDLVSATVHVRRSVFRGKLGPPKTGRSRAVPMTDELRERLLVHRMNKKGRTPFAFPSAECKLTVHQDEWGRGRCTRYLKRCDVSPTSHVTEPDERCDLL